jgi:hypothetical protein
MRHARNALFAMMLVAAHPLSAATSANSPAVADRALYDSDDVTIVKKSRDGICHDASSAGFARTLHYRAYRNMKDCLDSGGRRPR